MDISTGSWFDYLREEVLTEGLRDIGLPEDIVDFIEDGMPNAPEKSKTYVGNRWKERTLTYGSQRIAAHSWENFIERNFKDQVQVQAPSDENDQEARANVGKSPIIARTMTPYYVGGVDGKPVVRKMYDEETVKQNERIVLITLNVRNAFGKPAGTWRKVFMKAVKALSKAGVASEKVEVVKNELARINMYKFRDWWNQYDLLFAWLDDEATNYEMIAGEDNIDEAYNIAKEDLEGSESPDQVLHQFEDGFYWYDLETHSCAVEAERMGHCGGDDRGTLMSLRKAMSEEEEAELSVSDRRRLGTSDSSVTMSWNASERILYQIKGYANDAPDDKYWDKIDWFIKNQKVEQVAETGEHSNDVEGFERMTEFLSEENPAVEFSMSGPDTDGIRQALNNIIGDYRGDFTSVEATVEDPEGYGYGEGDYARVYASYNFDITINLGWPGIVRQGDLLYPAIEADSDVADDNYDGIPEDSYTTLAGRFEEEVGIDNIAEDMPGDDYESSYEVRMAQGAVADDEDPMVDIPQTAHLFVSIRSDQTLAIANPDQVDDEFGYETRELLKFEDEEKYTEMREELRAELVNAEYAFKTPYDRTRLGLQDKTFRHWSVYSSGAMLEISWSSIGGRATKNVINNAGQIPQVIQMYGQDYDRHIGELYSRIFGSPMTNKNPPRLENVDLNRNMARNLEKLYSAKQENPDQQQMGFGPEYAAKAARIILAKDSHFIIQGTNSAVGQNSRYPTQPIDWLYKIRMNSRTSEGEIQATQDILDFFNENPEMMNQAAQKTIEEAVSGILALAEARKDDISTGRQPYAQIRRIESMMGAQVEANHLAMKGMMIATWINQNFEQMDEIEKYVSYYKYLRPIVNQQIARIGPIQTDGDDAGKPDYFDQEVRTQLVKMGATSSQVDSRKQDPIRGRMGAPRPAGAPAGESSYFDAYSDDVRESVEEQIDRIDRMLLEQSHMLDELVDVRRYVMEIDLLLDTSSQSTIEDYKDTIRACEGVTTLGTISTRVGIEGTSAIFRLKFALQGQGSRKMYLQNVLVPYLRNVNGVKIGKAGYSAPQEVGSLKEYSGGFGGNVYNMASLRGKQEPMVTPRASLGDVRDEWVNGGVRAYDTVMTTNSMGYHVMMPTEELWPYCAREYRAPKDAFDGKYQHFIKNGATEPVYVTIDRRGNISLKNEDIVWFAHKSGLEEIPVVYNFAMQA